MARQPNYNQSRVERDRAKREKKAEKLRQQEERTAQRQAGPDLLPNTDTDKQD